MNNLTPEELERLINEEFGDDIEDADEIETDFTSDEDDLDDPSDEEVESLTASDEDYGQSIHLDVAN